MRLVVLVLLAGCQSLLDLQPVRLTDASRVPDSPRAPDAPFVGDASPADAPPAVILVQDVAASSQSSTVTVSISTPVAQDMLIAIGGAENGVKQIYGAATSWKPAASSTVSPTIQIWYGVPDGSTDLVTLDGNGGKIWVEITEWRGLAPSMTFDAGSGGGGSGNITGNVNLGVNTDSAPDLLVFGVASYGMIGMPSGPWTSLHGIAESFVEQDVWYQLTSIAGMQAVAAMYDDDYDAALAAFRTMP